MKTSPRASRRAVRSALVLAGLSAFALVSVGCHEANFSPELNTGDITIYDDLFAVSAPTPEKVVAAGYWGAVYVSDDSGKSWKKGETGTRQLLYDVSMADAKRGWAVGQSGTILRTEDGGLTWVRQPNNKETEDTHLFAVQALDANTAWAVGEWGGRLFTDDGGRSWQDRSLTIDQLHPQFVWLSPPEQDKVRKGEKVYEDVGLTDVFCLPGAKDCWIIGEFGYIFHSENGGQSWMRAAIQQDISVPPIVLDYNEIEISETHGESLREFAKKIIDLPHLNVAIEPVASAAEIAAFGKEDKPEPLFEILEARVQAVSAVLEEAGLLSDRIR
ncbi:MAG: YCF48-related protein, partial [Proteobacteria bacterium]|nr:YCF48-related protein [Pseudomonadota bacterium]